MIRPNNLLRLGIGALPVPVADNNAKLALVGILAGYVVRITGESNRLEMYLGNVSPATNGVTVSGAGSSEANGIYTWRGVYVGDYGFYNKIGDSDSAEYGSINGELENNMRLISLIGDNLYQNTTGVEYFPPWQGEWFVADGNAPSPTFTENPIANSNNWRVLGPVS